VGFVRAGYQRVAGLDAALRCVEELSARTAIFDVEPLVAYWDSSQQALERGVALFVTRACQLPEVQVVCFATNSARRPQAVPECAGARVVYLASAGKPVRIAPYQGFPRPGVVVGDQIATDGLLARRLGYAFVDYRPPLDEIPAGPRLLRQLGRLVRPVAFSRPVRSSR
jgi:predicted HAD superfamily phosphohydrolase YqeG